jgi:hypothetical protein
MASKRSPFILRYGSRSVPVASIEEASRLYSEARDASGKGASQWPDGSILQNGEAVYRISYNGRVWSMDEWEPGMKPVYRPHAPSQIAA